MRVQICAHRGQIVDLRRSASMDLCEKMGEFATFLRHGDYVNDHGADRRWIARSLSHPRERSLRSFLAKYFRFPRDSRNSSKVLLKCVTLCVYQKTDRSKFHPWKSYILIFTNNNFVYR